MFAPYRLPAPAVILLAFVLLAVAPDPAHAQWSRELALPAADVYSLTIQGDTLLAGVEQGVWVSVNGGATWTRSADVPGPAVSVEAIRMERGLLWCGTFGQGVFISANLGASWQAFSQGLAGGLFDSHLYITDFERRGDWLYASTDGAGIFRLNLPALAAWSAFNTNLVGAASGAVPNFARGGARLVCANGGNGYVFHNDEGDPDWTESPLNNNGISVGLQASDVAWTGSAWLVAAQPGVFRSTGGEAPWALAGHGLSTQLDGRLAVAPGRVFAAFNSLAATTYLVSLNDGVAWTALETFPQYSYELGVRGTTLWVARTDGLWRRDVSTVDAGPTPGPPALSLAPLGAQPARGEMRLRFTLPAAGRATLAIHDVRGRLVARLVDGELAAGAHEATWGGQGAAAGVYLARLTTPAGERIARVVRAR